MTTLVIETATAACSVALLDGEQVLAAIHEEVGRGHAERLVPMIGVVLAEAARDRAASILVDCGPGSFTGIRVGLAAARALGLAWGVPVAGYSAPALIAAREGADLAEPADGTIGVAMLGGHGEVFVQRFALSPLAPLDALRSLKPGDAADAIGEARILGSGAEALIAARGHGAALPRLPHAADARLLPAALATLPPSPIYGRAPDAALPR